MRSFLEQLGADVLFIKNTSNNVLLVLAKFVVIERLTGKSPKFSIDSDNLVSVRKSLSKSPLIRMLL